MVASQRSNSSSMYRTGPIRFIRSSIPRTRATSKRPTCRTHCQFPVGGDSGQSVNVDDTFSALDGDSDGKVTKSELTEAMTKLSDQLNAQFDASRVGRGGPPPDGPPPPSGPPPDGEGEDESGGDAGHGWHERRHGRRGGRPAAHGGGHAGGDGAPRRRQQQYRRHQRHQQHSPDYVAAADTDGDGTVSETEQAAYDKKVASEKTDSGNETSPVTARKKPRTSATRCANWRRP
jgi:hypothetical protein